MTTITFLRFQGIKKLWMFNQMGKFTMNWQLSLFHHPDIRFVKVLGSGSGNGFSIWPDFSTYALLIVWNRSLNQDKLKTFNLLKHLLHQATENWTVYLRPFKTKGLWSGQNPFQAHSKNKFQGKATAVLTRASINPKKMWSFWNNVPKVSEHMQSQPGLVFARGIGEIPLLEQATFSIWNRTENMVDYAYRQKKHQEVIKKTRKQQWYTEELFTQFSVVDSYGSWLGEDPLKHHNFH